MARKRFRISKVCDFCKKRKVKCDLGNPCSTCAKYAKGEPCVYSENIVHFDSVSSASSSASSIRSRKYSQEEEAIAEELSIRSESTDSTNSMGTNNVNRLVPIDELEISSTNTSYPNSIVQDELEQLKQKLKTLEESLILHSGDNSPEIQMMNNIQQPSTTMPPLLSSLSSSTTMTSNIDAPPIISESVFTQVTTATNNFTSVQSVDVNKLIGYNPVESVNETINFYDGYCPTHDKEPIRRRNFGPFSWISLTKMDTALGSLWGQLGAIKEQYRIKMMVPTSNAPQVEKDFSEKVNAEEGYNDIRPYRDAVKDNNTTNGKLKQTQQQEGRLNAKALSLGLSFYEGGLDAEMELVEKIQLVLPKRRAVWLLYKRFYTHLYAAFPFLDEVIFKEQIQKLIGYENHQDIPTMVKVEKRLDFAYLGILLLILRFSYLSLFSNEAKVNEANLKTTDPSPKAQQLKYLLNNPVNIDVVDVAQSCLDQFSLMRSINMTIMQLALYTRLYHQYSPEDGDGINGGDAQVFNAILIQMAYTLGLHREPDMFPDACNDEKVNNLGRKIWYYLLITDINDSLANGTLVNIDKDSFDTRPPAYKPGNENCIDVELEKLTCQCLAQFENSYEGLYDLLTKILKLKGSIKMTELAEKLNYLEGNFMERFHDIINHFDVAEDVTQLMIPRSLRMKIYFTCNFFIVSIYLHIFNHYERKANTELAYYYLKKIFVVVILESMPFFCECVSHSHMLLFRESTDLVVIPGYETVAHKSLLVISAVYLRIRSTISILQSRYDHTTRMKSSHPTDDKYRIRYQKLNKIAELLLRCRDVFREGIAKLSHRYYYAWRITKAQNFLSNVINRDDFIQQYRPANGSAMSFSLDMLDELEFIIERSLAKVQETKKKPKFKNVNPYQRTPTSTTTPPTNATINNNNNSNGNGFPYSATPLFGTSTSNSEVDMNEYKPNEQIDSIWLSMMNMKNEFGDPGSKYGLSNPGAANMSNNNLGNVGSGIIANGTLVDPLYNSMSTPAFPGIETSNNNVGFSPMPQIDAINTNDLFENFPIDELFKDFS
ncbi:uncharacterized protein J8A68_005845 [[Candida] subhashii]|uniref:Zn(2)-C6 fungal-type domain-containing protein n=1 Tax=[Candida] subhashii TaxID=561895 RepID=A0A8J5QDS2_9ASCO|nr:uncharacterized protein J8A68_005845 [[Candida] subhashii]KAG7660579.1 hypothetical protein J8A68_005845 [[Candida] subhashii]